MNFFSLLILMFSLVYTSFVDAQKVDLTVQSTLSFSGPNALIGIQDKVIYDTDLSISTIRGSLGAGNSLEIASKLNITEQIGLGLEYHFFKSFEFTTNHILTHTSNFESTLQAKQQSLQPSISFKIPFPKLNFILKTGLIIPIMTKSTQTDFFENDVVTTKRTEQLDYNFSFGYTNSLGFEAKLYKGLFFNFFLTSNLMNLSLKNRKTTSYEVNGIDVVNDLSVYDANSNYNEDINNYSNNEYVNNQYDTKKAKDEITKSHSFNAIGLTFGFTYHFSKNKK